MCTSYDFILYLNDFFLRTTTRNEETGTSTKAKAALFFVSRMPGGGPRGAGGVPVAGPGGRVESREDESPGGETFIYLLR